MTAAILMGVGAFIWLVGELAAVLTHRKLGEPTTWYIRHFQQKWPIVRILVILFLAWLGLHFEFHLP